jgi:phenylacetate-CoA ligase
LFKNTPQIAEAQIIQEDINEVCVKVIPASGYSNETEDILMADMRSYLGDQIAIRIIRVNEIPREKNGKFRQIVSTVFKDRHENSGKYISL